MLSPKDNLSAFGWLTACALLVTPHCVSADVKQLETANGPLHVAAALADGRGCSNPHGWRWGAEQACPKVLIDTLKITYDGHDVFVPLSAYADLGNPRTLSAKQDSNGGWIVHIEGGDAAVSYVSELSLSSTHVSARTVRHGELPSSVWEKTEYSWGDAE